MQLYTTRRIGGIVPCFPRKEPRVIQPEETVQYKNVNRYGETNIRHVQAPLKQDQWKKGNRDPNAGRTLPDTPQEVIVERQRPPSGRPPRPYETESLASSTPRQPQRRYKQPVTADFFVSVPIFNETLDHSYRKKNQYVYVDRPDDDASLYHQSLSRGSSLRDLRQDSLRRQDSLQRQNSEQYYREHREREYRERQRPSSLNRHIYREHRRERRQKLASGSEASFNTYSSRGTYSYESETFEEARKLRKARSGAGINVDSDDEDCR